LFVVQDARQGDALILRRAAAQVLGLFLDARPQAFLKKKKMQKLVALLLAPLVRAAAATTNPDDATTTTSGGDADDDVSTAAGLLDEEGDMSASSAKWGVEYYSLRVLEKAFSLDSAMASGVQPTHCPTHHWWRNGCADGMCGMCVCSRPMGCGRRARRCWWRTTRGCAR
jgi:hypothetical protein